MIALDTNVVSELMRPKPATQVIDWLDQQRGADLYLTAITVAELLYGVARLPPGQRKTRLFELVEGMVGDDFEHRVLPFDETAAAHYAHLVTQRERAGRPISMADVQIAAICRSRQAELATRNITDFEDTQITVHNPWMVV